MKITRRQLKKIINEEIQNPCLAAAEKFARLEGNIIVIDGTIKFVTGKTTLKPESYELLDAVVCILNYDGSMPYNGVKVVGHTDSVGSDSMNMNLSQGRAKSVADYLIGAGVNDWRVSSEGLGETNPIAANDTEDGRAKNRRVEFQIVYGVKQRLVPLTQAEPIIPPGAELSAFEKEHGYNPNLMDSRHPDFSKELRANEGVKMKITRKQLRRIIEESISGGHFEYADAGAGDESKRLSTAEAARMYDAGVDSSGRNRDSPEAQPYLDSPPLKIGYGDDRTEIYDETDDDMALSLMGDTPYAVDDSQDMMDRGTNIRGSLEGLRAALQSGPDLGPDDRDALLGVIDSILKKG